MKGEIARNNYFHFGNSSGRGSNMLHPQASYGTKSLPFPEGLERPAACDSIRALGEGRLIRSLLAEYCHIAAQTVKQRQKVTKIVTSLLKASRRAVDSGPITQDYARAGFKCASAMSEWKRVMAAPLIAAYRNRAARGFLDTGEVDRTNEQTQIDRRSERQPLNSRSIRLMNRYLPCMYTAGVPK